jgi:hypothetical protein
MGLRETLKDVRMRFHRDGKEYNSVDALRQESREVVPTPEPEQAASQLVLPDENSELLSLNGVYHGDILPDEAFLDDVHFVKPLRVDPYGDIFEKIEARRSKESEKYFKLGERLRHAKKSRYVLSSRRQGRQATPQPVDLLPMPEAA